MEKVDYLILGHGYTAQFLIEELPSQAKWLATSRSDQKFHYFDLTDVESWDQLPSAKVTYWTFPPTPIDLVKDFYSENKEKLGKLVVVGSTSGFLTTESHQEVTETTPFDESIERAQAEKLLMDQGATVVMSSGIYGPGKNPVDWVKNGYVGKSEKFVNMIHVKDLANIIFNAGEKGKSNSVYIASDGVPLQWSQVIELWEKEGLLANIPEKESKRSSKKINSSATMVELGIDLKHRNFANVVINEF